MAQKTNKQIMQEYLESPVHLLSLRRRKARERYWAKQPEYKQIQRDLLQRIDRLRMDIDVYCENSIDDSLLEDLDKQVRKIDKLTRQLIRKLKPGE